VFLVCLLEPDKCLVVFTETEIGVDKSGRGDVTSLLAFL